MSTTAVHTGTASLDRAEIFPPAPAPAPPASKRFVPRDLSGQLIPHAARFAYSTAAVSPGDRGLAPRHRARHGALLAVAADRRRPPPLRAPRRRARRRAWAVNTWGHLFADEAPSSGSAGRRVRARGPDRPPARAGPLQDAAVRPRVRERVRGQSAPSRCGTSYAWRCRSSLPGRSRPGLGRSTRRPLPGPLRTFLTVVFDILCIRARKMVLRRLAEIEVAADEAAKTK